MKAFLYFVTLALWVSCTSAYAQVNTPNENETPPVVISAKGTGQTTGHIATLTVRNPGKHTINLATQTFYIPSNGRYQSYVGRISPGHTIPPGQSITIPVTGYCTDVHTPPVSLEEDMPSINSWLPVGTSSAPASQAGLTSLIQTVPLPEFDLSQIGTVSQSGGFTANRVNPEQAIIVTWPGTDRPLGGTIDINKFPQDFAPLVVNIVNNIEKAADHLIATGMIKTPFSGNQQKEREAVVQQTTWIIMASLGDDDYDKEDFTEKVYEQFESNSGQKISKAPLEVKKQVDNGVNDFWNAFQATGIEAKVVRDNNPELISDPEPTIPPAEEVSDCAYTSDFKFNPELAYDHKIAESWGDVAERDSIKARLRRQISIGMSADPDENYAEYDIARNPTSTVAFWRANHVGGWASAYARTWFEDAEGNDEWVWSTENMESSSQGSNEFWMEFDHDASCKSVVVGTSISRISAKGTVFDAVAGNDENSLPTLRAYTWLGKQAVLFLIERKMGRTKDGFGKYVKDAATDEVKDALKEELEAKAMEVLDQLLEKLGIEIPDELANIPNIDPTNIEEVLEEFLGIDIPSIEEGVDAAFNLFFWSNTYATAFGAMNITVGDQKGTVQALTRKMYLRQGLEDAEDAAVGTNNQCSEMILTDAKPKRLQIDTWGLSTMTAHADGNGYAKSQLYSMHFELLIGVCICPKKKPLVVSAELNGWYQPDKGPYGKIGQADVDAFVKGAEKHLQQKIDDGSLNGGSEMASWSNALDEYARQWAKDHPFSWKDCQDK